MKKMMVALLAAGLCLAAFSCKKKESAEPSFSVGKNRFTLQIDGTEREFFVHVPKNYDGKTAFPVVFMLHGTSGDGEKFYDGSGWKEVGETEGIITVFPSSGRYCIDDPTDGKITTTKWNTTPDADWTFCPNETPLDDIHFLTKIIDDLHARFNLDEKRFYLVGFSNGGQMAAKCCVEMSDRFAAIVQSASSFYRSDVTYTPKRKLPITYQVGNDDWGPGGEGPDLPLSQLDSLLLFAPNFKYYRISQAHIRHFDLDPSFEITGDTTKAVVAEYKSATGQADNTFQFVMIKGIKHAYPDYFAAANWTWLKQFRLP